MRSLGSTGATAPALVFSFLALVAGVTTAQEGPGRVEPVRRPSLVPQVEVPTESESGYYTRYQLEGIASWYGGKFQGRLTANGETFDTNKLTAAHRELPFDTIVRVTNTQNGMTVDVRINDRGPFVDNRVIDLSRAAADAIGITSAGVAPVTLEVVDYRPVSTLRTIQIASFGRRGNAEALVERLGREGLKAEIETAGSSTIHRVVLIEVDESELDGTRRRLGELGYSNVLVRRE